jgi:hypothetical protein
MWLSAEGTEAREWTSVEPTRSLGRSLGAYDLPLYLATLPHGLTVRGQSNNALKLQWVAPGCISVSVPVQLNAHT